jgi:ComF family protein
MQTLKAFLDIVYPRPCACCGARVGAEGGCVCWDCRARFEYIKDDYCACCGDPVDGVAGNSFLCAACVSRKPAYRQARSVLRHRGGFRDALWAFKYGHACFLAEDFAGLLKGCVDAHFPAVRFDAVTSVPLHPRKERSRTYNQSALLGCALARRLGVPYFGRCLVRERDTSTQTRLSAAARRRNVRGAFGARAEDWIGGRRLLLVDDVMTTGATVDECSRVLCKAGATTVHVVTVARG